MKFEPHDYQDHTIRFIEEKPEAAIFLGMGLGKTIITLTAINNLIRDTFTVRKALIIAPLRVARDTWPNELKKWDHLQGLRMSVIVGPKHTREAALNQDADIYVINRENLPWLLKNLTGPWPFDMVVIDELSSFKNHQSQRFKALRAARPHIHRIIGLTGTPAPNSLLDLWAPFRLLDQGERLGKFITHYRDHYFLPDKRNGQRIFTWKLRDGADQDIYDAIADITISMRTTDYLNLPDMTTTDRTVALTDKQRKHYTTLRDEMITTIDGETIDAGSAATLSGKLQQLASGAIYIDPDELPGHYVEIHDQKLDALEDILEAAAGNTVLVAYWFKHELSRMKHRFPHGRELNTADDMDDWNAGTIPLAFIHPASAGHGLNLQDGGHNLVWLTLPWSLELYEQTNARLFRQGQTEPVSIIHIIADNTIDQQIVRALADKNVTQSALIDAVSAELGADRD